MPRGRVLVAAAPFLTLFHVPSRYVMMFLRVLLSVFVCLAGSAVSVRAQSQSAPANPPKATPQTLSIPSPETMLVMVRAALIALDQANKTGNYTVMHGIGGPQLQQNNPAKLGDMFAALRQ